MVLTQAELTAVADRLVEVPGVVAVALGGSRARGAALPDSDVDLGLYYRPPLDVDALDGLARALGRSRDGTGPPGVTQPGAWGGWVDGGGWLTIGQTPVDWLYRDLDRVRRSCDRAEEGAFDFHFQVGHPLGVPDFAYAGEVALGVVLADPTGELRGLKARLATYPPRLRDAVVERLAEAEFVLGGLEKPARRGDAVFVAGSLFRVVELCAHAVHARAGRWVVNEKGLVTATGRLAGAPPRFTERANALLGRLGTDPADLEASVAAARALLGEVATG